ncbi:MAG: Rrf2 family transcriptional regulator, partial [Alphaproteobacteria bacterium]|nr:Rrf2 family transcriptional regulator [Alphaproteobacteria bacterium]
THDLWEELGNQIYLYLSSVSLADVVDKRVLGSSGRVFRSGDGAPPDAGGRIAAAE